MLPFFGLPSAFVTLATAGAAPNSTLPNPDAGFGAVVRALGGLATRNGCTRSVGTLIDRTLVEWRTRPGSDWYAPEWACLSLEDNIARDSMAGCLPAPVETFRRPLALGRRIEGELAYVGIDPREYAYDLIPLSNGDIQIFVGIAFAGSVAARPGALERVQTKLDAAAAFWSKFSPGGRMHFLFRALTDGAPNPHFRVELAEGAPRTPYDSTWGDAWSAHLMAHELGHMMGLDDEYEQIRKTLGHALGREAAWRADPVVRLGWLRCHDKSLMCDSKGEDSTPQRAHYYVILRRRFCRTVVTPYPEF